MDGFTGSADDRGDAAPWESHHLRLSFGRTREGLGGG